MKKNRKRAAMLALVIGMSVVGSMAGYAADADAGMVNAAGTAKSELVGTITVTQLNVTLPLKAAFDIDPTTYTGTASQVGTQSTNYTITNNSAVPVWVYMSDVSNGLKDGTSNNAVLTNKTGDLDTDKNLMIAIKEDGSTLPANLATASDFWLVNGSNPNSAANKVYYMDKAGTGKLGAQGNTSSEATSLKLQVFALTKKGWKASDTFAITPTFTVAVEPYAAP